MVFCGKTVVKTRYVSSGNKCGTYGQCVLQLGTKDNSSLCLIKGATSLEMNWQARALYNYLTREKYKSMSFSYKDTPSLVEFWNERLMSLAALQVSLFRHPGNYKGQLTSEGYSENGIVSSPGCLSLSGLLHKCVRLVDKIWRSAEYNLVIHSRTAVGRLAQRRGESRPTFASQRRILMNCIVVTMQGIWLT